MNSLFIPKMKRDRQPAIVSKVIYNYLSTIPTELLIISPGYLSTTEESIKKFLSHFSPLIDKVDCAVLLNGMNGESEVKGSSNQIIQQHIDFNKKIKKAINKKANKKNHSKIIFFININEGIKVDEIIGEEVEVDLKKIKSNMNSINVNGILIGSSNLSYTTYFSDPAPKGESDILIFNDSDVLCSTFEKEIKSQEYSFCALSKDLIINEKDYLNAFLISFLEKAIEEE